MWSDERAPDEMRATGGSTGEPLRIPVWKSEIAHAAADMWYLRRGLGISPGDRMFLLWGHSHHLGRGWTGRMRRIRRDIADRLLGYRRWSAYDLSESGLRRAVDAMLRFRPSVLLGYSVALDRLARMNGDRRDALRTLGLRAVISTAEAFPRTDSAERLADLFDAPVLMEYGAVESGVIAHQRIDGSWLALWNTHFLEGVRRPDLGNRYELLLTSLHPRCLPLVRYRIGDLVEGDPLVDPARLPPVIGRCNDSLALPGGRFIHSEAFTHVLRDIPGIESFQVTQLTDLAIRLDYVGPQPLNERTIGEIRRRLGRVDEDLRGIEIRRTEALQQTVAGKTRFVRSVH